MIVFVEILLISVFGVFLLYLALLSILALTVREQIGTKTSRFRRMAVIVPAHDEELTIQRTLQSLLAVDYPRDRFDVIVAADNCTDGTIEIAGALGAIVYERKSDTKMRGKGYALRWCLDVVLSGNTSYDAVAVVDADSVVSRNFLSILNFYLEKGAQAIQCSDKVEPQHGTWNPEVTRVGFTLYTYVRPLGRRVIRCSAGLYGNGMCFTTEILRRIPWEAYSLTEDLEYGLELLLRGVTVVFAPEAIALAAMPHSPENAESQRARWEMGRIPVVRRYAPRLLREVIKRRSFSAFIALVDLVIPPLVNLFAFVVVMLLLSVLLWKTGVEETPRFSLFWSGLLALGAIHVLLGLYAAKGDRSLYKALLYIPRYALWKLILYAKFLRHRQTEKWLRTGRDPLSMHQKATETGRN